MKLFKKIVSMVAVASMLASMSLVVSAATHTMTWTATPAADHTYVDITLDLSDGVAGAKTMGTKVKIDPEVFDVDALKAGLVFELWDDDEETGYESVVQSIRSTKEPAGWSTSLNAGRSKASALSYDINGNLVVTFFSTSTTTIPESQSNFITVRLYPVGGADSKIWTDGYTIPVMEGTWGDYNTTPGSANQAVMVTNMTIEGTATPTVAPTAEPTVAPTAEPTVAPTAEPTVEPTAAPIAPVEYTGDVVEGDSSKVTDKTLAWTFDVPVLEGQNSIIFKIWNSADPSHKWQKVVTDEVALDGVVGNAKVGLLFTFNPEDPDYIAKFGNVKMDSGIAIAE